MGVVKPREGMKGCIVTRSKSSIDGTGRVRCGVWGSIDKEIPTGSRPMAGTSDDDLSEVKNRKVVCLYPLCTYIYVSLFVCVRVFM